MAQIRSIRAAGNEIGGHSRTHPDLTTLTRAQMTTEVCGGRTDLINQGLGPVVSFAYPFGTYSATIEAVVSSCGFNNARAVGGHPDTIPPANAFATKASQGVRDCPPLTSGSPPTTVGEMEGWVRSAQSNSHGKWVQFVWHDIVPSANQAEDKYCQLTPHFNAFLTWLKGEVNGGRAVVKTAAQVMG